MTKHSAFAPDPALRRRAEQELEARAGKGRGASQPLDDVRRLLHELEVHEIELEVQNEELVASRYETESALQRYTEIFDFAPMPYVVLNADGTVRECNFACARMLAFNRERVLGQPFTTFLAQEQATTFHEFLRLVLSNRGQDETSRTVEMLLWLESGRPLEVMLIASALTGTEPRALVAVQDLSARKRAEAALRAEAIVREESVRKDEFMATLSHELRNPLAPIRTSVTVLERGGPHSDEEQRALAVLHRQVDHLVRIVDDLLDATRIARGKVLLQRDAVDLGELARRLVEDYRRGFEARGVALSVQVEPPAPIWVSGDPTRLNQILGNLLGNSLKFTPAGGHVDVRLRREASSAFLIVRDDGVGIAAGVRRRLFQPFIQAPQSLERSHGGLGLGLVMVKGLAELHGGGVHVESEGVGRGATFTVRLPLIPAPLAVGPRPTPGGGRHNSGPLRVLVIEDNVDAGDMLRDLLALDGHEVEVAYDGRSGLELSRDFRPDVVLCDLGLPGMDGFEVARAMRSDPQLRGVHLVALSGYTRPEDRDRALAAGFDAHVPKPLNPEVLERVLRG